MIEIKEGTYVSAMWFLPLHRPKDADGVTYEEGDWMCTLYRLKGEIAFRASMRFRYYLDDKAHDSKDKKSGYMLGFKEGQDESACLAIIADLTKDLVAASGETLYKLVLRSDDPAFILKRLSEEEWVSMRRMEKP